MKNSNGREDKQQTEARTEILKAVAQAWLGHSGSSKSTDNNEHDTYRRSFPLKPSRFKLEAAAKKQPFRHKKPSATKHSWDFNNSLLDSYEIVTMSKRIERGLILDDTDTKKPRPRESKNSLRSLFTRFSSERFNQVDFPPQPI